MVAVAQVAFGDRARAAGAFGDVLARHLEMHAAGIDRFAAADGEERADFGGDALGRPRLVAARGLDRVAVHRVADPQHAPALALDGADQRRQRRLDLVGAEAADQRQPPRLRVGIERVDQADEVVGLDRRAAFEADRVLHPAAIFDMRAAERAGAVADPHHVARGRVIVARGRVRAGSSPARSRAAAPRARCRSRWRAARDWPRD